MTAENLNTRRCARAPAMITFAALALTGCAATHIGEDWQCPSAQGARCVSVAAADPALRSAGQVMEGSPGNMEIVGPSRPSGGPSAHSQPVPAKPDAENRAGRREGCAVCRPFAFLARLLRGGSAGGSNPAGGPADNGPVDSGPADGASANSGPSGGLPSNDEAQDAAAPAGPDAQAADAPTADADLRAPERIGRVWIAPYVDADGVYREASWVRIVIAPADWKR